MDEKIQLRINEIPAQHVGKGIVIVDPSVIKKYGWHAGQILEIVGSRKTYAKLWPGSMENNDFDYIRIDGWHLKSYSINNFVFSILIISQRQSRQDALADQFVMVTQ